MKELFEQLDLIIEMGKIQAGRLSNGELIMPEKTEDLKTMLKNKILELTYRGDNKYIKIKKEPNKIIIYDIIVLLFELLRRQDDGLGVNKKEPYPAGS